MTNTSGSRSRSLAKLNTSWFGPDLSHRLPDARLPPARRLPLKGTAVRTGTALFGSLCALALLSGCGEYPPLEVVPSVDLERYAGKWYEIASLPVSQQEGCNCTTAEYTAID